MTRKPSLTRTQQFILATARDAGGVIFFYRGDRKGTRKGGTDEFGRPGIIAYSTPEVWLLTRGLIERYGNERDYYRLTEAGSAAIGDSPVPNMSKLRARWGW